MGIAIFLMDLKVHFVIYVDRHRLIAVRTDCIYSNGKRFFSQAPLHEGRGNCIDCSGGVNLLAGAESQLVRCLVGSNRIRPEDFTVVIAYQKK